MQNDSVSPRRQRSSLRDLRRGLNNKTVEAEIDTIEYGDLTIYQFEKVLTQKLADNDNSEARLALFEIQFDVTKMPSEIERKVTSADVREVMLERCLNELGSAFFYAEDNRIVGLLELTGSTQSAEASIGALIKQLAVPFEIDGYWQVAWTRSACVYTDALESPAVSDCLDALALTIAETNESLHFLVYNPFLSKRRERDSEMLERMQGIVNSKSISHHFKVTEDIDSGAVTGIELVPQFVVAETKEPVPTEDAIKSSVENGLIYELGRLSRQLGAVRISPGLHEACTTCKAWFPLTSEELHAPGIVEQLQTLAVTPGKVGIILKAESICYSKYLELVFDELERAQISLQLKISQISKFDYSLLSKLPVRTATLELFVDGPISDYPELSKRIEILALVAQNNGTQLCLANVRSSGQAKEAEVLGFTQITRSAIATTIDQIRGSQLELA